MSKITNPDSAQRVRQQPQTLSVEEAGKILGISRSSAFQAAVYTSAGQLSERKDFLRPDVY